MSGARPEAVRPPSPFARTDVVGRYEEWYATPYGRVADRIEQALIRELLGPLAPGASVVEIGCGTGHFAHALTRSGFAVVGLDPAWAMLGVARGRVPVACADGLRLPLRDASFDAALLVAVLEFVKDPVALLLEAARVARRRVVLLTVTSRSWLGLRRRLAGWRGHPIFSRARFRSRGEVLAMAHAARLHVVQARTVLLLPPLLAGRWPRLEERLSTGALPGGGVLGLALSRTAALGDASSRSAAPATTGQGTVPLTPLLSEAP